MAAVSVNLLSVQKAIRHIELTYSSEMKSKQKIIILKVESLCLINRMILHEENYLIFLSPVFKTILRKHKYKVKEAEFSGPFHYLSKLIFEFNS